MISRRGFLSGILAAASAPAIVRASSLMKLPPSKILLPSNEIIAAPFSHRLIVEESSLAIVNSRCLERMRITADGGILIRPVPSELKHLHGLSC